MSTAPLTDVSKPAQQLRLPRFEGFAIPTARLAFTGALELKLTNDEDIKLVEAIKLGQEMTVTLAVDGHERELVLGARCTSRSHRFRKEEHSEALVGTHTITINDVREGDEEAE